MCKLAVCCNPVADSVEKMILRGDSVVCGESALCLMAMQPSPGILWTKLGFSESVRRLMVDRRLNALIVSNRI
jgi:hypothetical protein